jgi:prepilin-type N-terminal cleavage/methylation domain-containing protein
MSGTRISRPMADGRRAFTVIELLIVMSIIALLVSISLVSFVGITRRASREGAARNLQNVLRQARMSAVDGGRGAVVRIDPPSNTLYGLASRVQAAWHFDALEGAAPETTPGAKNMDGTVTGTPSLETGMLGLSLEFSSGDVVNCGNYPIFDQTDGIRLEAYVRPADAGAGTGTVMAKTDGAGAGYELEVSDAVAGAPYDLEATFYLADGATVVNLQAEEVLPEREWRHVAVEYDGYEARLYVNGILVDLDSFDPNDDDGADPNDSTDLGWAEGELIEPARGDDLEVGRGFTGRIDEPLLLSVAGGDRVTFPEEVGLATSATAVHFDTQGFLDLIYHPVGVVYAAVGDPYQGAELDADITDSDTSLTVRPRNPFPATGGYALVGPAGGPYEVMAFTGVADNTLTGLTRGIGVAGTAADAHSEGERVLYGRVVRVMPTGLVERID